MNLEEENICPACGSAIPDAAPLGMCPKCLLAETVNGPPPKQLSPSQQPSPTKDPAQKSKLETPPSAAPAKGAASHAPSKEALQDLFPDLEILDLLGAGGMGAVYKARQIRLGRMIALKVLACPPEMHESFSLRFEREAQLLAKLHHPHIVTLFDFGEIENGGPGGLSLFYFLMEYVDGSDLAQRIRVGSLTPDETLAIVPQICEALQIAHDEGITHRDVKPANILIDSKGQVKVADFGVAKIVGNEDDMMTGLTMTGTTMGTPHYMAPEQWDAPENVDHRSDIYSLGVIFYQMLTGERPAGVFDPPSKTVSIDPRLDAVVLRAMEKRRAKRYQRAGDLGRDVTKLGSSRRRSSGVGSASARRLGIAAVTVAVLLLAGWGWWELRPDIEKETLAGTPPVTGSEVTSGTSSGSGPVKEDPFVPLVPSLGNPGRLRAAGTDPNGGAADLSKVAAFDDIVDVGGQLGEWVALRSNGETISFKGDADLTNIARIGWSFDHHYALIDRQGKIHFPKNRQFELGADFDEARIVDVQLGNEHGIALTEEGQALVFGQRYEEEVGDLSAAAGYGTPRWPQPSESALIDIKEVAVTQTHAATLSLDGKLSVFGWEGMVEFDLNGQSAPIVSISSDEDIIHLLDAEGGVWKLALTRNLSPNQPVTGVGTMWHEDVSDQSIVKLSGLGRLTAEGDWIFSKQVLSALVDQSDLSPSHAAVLLADTGSSKDGQYASLLWIEPKPELADSSPFPLSRPVRPKTGGKVVAWHVTQGFEAEPSGIAVLPEGLDDVVAIDLGIGFGEMAGPNGETQHGLALHADGRVSAWGRDLAGETEVPSDLKPAVAIAAGQRFSVALHEDGTVSTWGWSPVVAFQKPVASWTDVVAVAAGSEHILALTRDGRVLSAGSGSEGNLKVPEDVQGRAIAISSNSRLSLALLEDGTVRMWGETDTSDADSLAAARDVAGIATLKSHPFTLDRKGRLSAHFPKSDSAYPPAQILEFGGITHLADEKMFRHAFAVYTPDVDRWHFWGGGPGWAAQVEKNLPRLGSLIDLEFALPDFLICIQQNPEKKAAAAYPTDEAGFREWLEGKVLPFDSKPDSEYHILYWIQDGRLHRKVYHQVNASVRSENWEYQVPESGWVTTEYWESGGFRISRDGLAFEYRNKENISPQRGFVRTDLSPPGTLRIAGTSGGGNLPDLFKVAGIDDFVAVGGRAGQWVALRANGETVSFRGNADFQNIRRIAWSYGNRFGLIDNGGKLRFAEGEEMELPADFDEIMLVDAKLGNDHGVALTDDGRALLFGKRYEEQVGDPADKGKWGTPRWPRPPQEILEGIKDIAVTQTHAATLKENGNLSIFGWEGVLELPQTQGLARIEAIGSSDDMILLLDTEGQVWRFLLPRNPAPDQPIQGGGKRVLKMSSDGDPAIALNGECWLGESGRWYSAQSRIEPLLESNQIGAERKFVASVGSNSGKPFQSLLWIEPAGSPDLEAAKSPNTKTEDLGPGLGRGVPGRLTASGTLRNGDPIDLSKAEGIADFVQVLLQSKGWIGLRANGETVSTDGQADRREVIGLYPISLSGVALLKEDQTLEFLANHEEKTIPVSRDIPDGIREIGIRDLVAQDFHAIVLLKDGTARVWGDLYDHIEKIPSWFKTKEPWSRPPAEALSKVISIGAGASWAGTVTEDGRLWIWDRTGIIELGEWEKYQGEFALLRKTAYDLTDAALKDGRLLGLNFTTGKHTLDKKPREIASTADTGYRPLYQDSEGHWSSSWPTKGIEPFLESLQSREPTEFSLNVNFTGYGEGGEQISIGLITIEPPGLE